ncbi:hypothetical protein CYLTODRAFT_131499 [Cylindrobasidium torrendii FP15055 ss-10]|uniref:Uncharacterized protein n=1 Tax=Cylindrobasidium torrendii FP15055 ss-10 TaxID=1314674 RepID=A0A0D7B237_9AGAR|nr:hypothetical protein CYLTODRAFT_131499 [Cylindrobasidium torrendii FP15055 ss-10]
MTPGEVATQASTMFSQASTSRTGSSRASSSRSPSRSTPFTDDYSSHRRTVDRLRSSDIDHPDILDSPTNPFGRTLKRALPDPTPYGKHITVRMRWVEPGYVPPAKRSESASEDEESRRPIAPQPRGHARGGAVRSRLAAFASGRQARVRGDANSSQDLLGAFRIVQVPLSYTFRHLTCLVKWLFEGEDGGDDGEWHVYTSIDGCTPSEARGVIRKPGSVEWVRVALGKGGPFERSASQPDMSTSGAEDDDDPFIDRSPIHLASEGEHTEDDEDEDGPTFEDPDGFLLGNVWMTDGKRISLDRGLVFTTGSPADESAEVHVTIHAGRAPEERKGKSNLPFVFGAKGRTRWSTGKIRSLDMCDSKFSDGTRFVEAWSRAQERRHREQGGDSDDDDEGYITRSDGDMVGQAVTDDEDDHEVPFRASSRSSEAYDVGGTWSSPLKKGGSFSSPGCRDALSSPVRAPAKRILHRTMHGGATPMPHPTFRKPLAYFKKRMEKSSREIEERARAKAKRKRLREITAARKKAQEQRAKEREISLDI